MNVGGSIVEPGQPHLPVSTFYAVEPGKNFSVQTTIGQTQTHENIDILPFQSWDNESTGIGEGKLIIKINSFQKILLRFRSP